MGLRDDLALMDLHQERGTLKEFMRGECVGRFSVDQIEDRKDEMKARFYGFNPRKQERDK
jgi:hypothetical protein